MHDPLGLELLLTAEIRGERVRFEDWEQAEVGSMEKLREKFPVEKHIFDDGTQERNTLRIGVVVLNPKR